MMAIGVNEINFDMTLDELKTTAVLLIERLAEMEIDLEKTDSHRYIKLLQLSGKINGLINLIESKKISTSESGSNTRV